MSLQLFYISIFLFNTINKGKFIDQSSIEDQSRFDSQISRTENRIIDSRMTKRKDVVLKTVLRKIRWNLRNDFLSRSKNLSRQNSKLILNMRKRLSNYISKFIANSFDDSFVDSLWAFILTEKIEKNLNILNIGYEEMELIKKIIWIREALYKFNFSRFIKMLQLPGFPEIIKFACKLQIEDSLDDDQKIGVQMILKEW